MPLSSHLPRKDAQPRRASFPWPAPDHDETAWVGPAAHNVIIPAACSEFKVDAHAIDWYDKHRADVISRVGVGFAIEAEVVLTGIVDFVEMHWAKLSVGPRIPKVVGELFRLCLDQQGIYRCGCEIHRRPRLFTHPSESQNLDAHYDNSEDDHCARATG